MLVKHYCCDKTPKENNLRGAFILVHSFRGTRSSCQRRASHIMVVRKRKESGFLLLSFCFGFYVVDFIFCSVEPDLHIESHLMKCQHYKLSLKTRILEGKEIVFIFLASITGPQLLTGRNKGDQIRLVLSSHSKSLVNKSHQPKVKNEALSGELEMN